MSALSVQVTRHARKRVHERLGLPTRAVVRAAALALRNGIGGNDAKGALRRYLNGKATINAEVMRVHNGAVYAFAVEGDVAHLITAWPLQRELRP